MYVIFAASMSLYIAKALWDNIQLIVMQYREWAMWYVLVTSLISFVICYRFGPVTNVRTKQIIQWFLQVSYYIIFFFNLLLQVIFSYVHIARRFGAGLLQQSLSGSILFMLHYTCTSL